MKTRLAITRVRIIGYAVVAIAMMAIILLLPVIGFWPALGLAILAGSAIGLLFRSLEARERSGKDAPGRDGADGRSP